MTHTSRLSQDKILELFKQDGLLSQQIKGFEARLVQQKMTANVIQAYNENKIALIEAGTGTGKSMAYLIPALIAAACNKERTVISTNTITLQEQLVSKDIPVLVKALSLNVKAALVKGMNNYACIRKIEEAQSELRLLPDQEAQELEKIVAWKASTKDGSRSKLSFVPSHATWERVGAESDTCTRNDCPYYQECFFFQARRQANDAQILVVNHHLLFADLSLRAETNNYDTPAILPFYQNVILDEAHHIEDVATEYFATRVTRMEMTRTLNRLSSEKQNKVTGKLPLLKDKIHTVFKNAPPTQLSKVLSSLNMDLPAMRRKIQDYIQEAFLSLTLFAEAAASSPNEESNQGDVKLRLLEHHQRHTDWPGEVIPRTQQLADELLRYSQSLSGIEASLKGVDHDSFQEQTKGIRFEIQALAMRLDSMARFLKEFISVPTTKQQVRWLETQKLRFFTNIHLVEAKLDISQALVDFLFSKFPTVVLCSATLTTNKSFDFIRERLGLTPKLLPHKGITENIYESPFNYPQQAMLVVPTDLPNPSQEGYTEAAIEKIWECIQASRGNAFVLFTSYTMLKQCYDRLVVRLTENRYHAFKQGDEHRNILLHKFKTTNYSVLFGTDSFWEGVDVVGEALRCVIIVKLPFKVPTEPIIQARTEALIAQGKDPFLDYSIPTAIVKFKQGFGRLIRNKKDRGCIVCLDTRLITKNYGKMFLNSLPACRQLFAEGPAVKDQMAEFYRMTYHLVAK